MLPRSMLPRSMLPPSIVPRTTFSGALSAGATFPAALSPGPLIRTTRPEPTPTRTVPYLLRDGHDEVLFEHYTRSQIAELAPAAPPPGCWGSRPSGSPWS
jgi:hypothetical protein